MVMTLDELKAKNAEDEALNQQETAPVEEVEEDEAAEVEAPELEEVAEPNQEESEETEALDWMQAEDEPKFTDGDVAAAKRKLRAKLDRKIDEKDAEIERLKAQLSTPTQSPIMERPKREDFGYDDEKFDEAMEKYILSRVENVTTAKNETTQRQQQMEAQRKQVEQKVDQHYERVAKLAAEAKIEPEIAQAADLKVRTIIDRVFNGSGDEITDHLISSLGEGSEKAMFFLGRNPTAQAEFESKLREDPNGIQAAIYLGELKSRFNAPKSRVSNAPKPAKQINGDAQGGDLSIALKKRYEKAGNDVQKRIDIKREAKSKGVDTKSW